MNLWSLDVMREDVSCYFFSFALLAAHLEYEWGFRPFVWRLCKRLSRPSTGKQLVPSCTDNNLMCFVFLKFSMTVHDGFVLLMKQHMFLQNLYIHERCPQRCADYQWHGHESTCMASHTCCLLNFALNNKSGWPFFYFGWEDTISTISKNYLNCGLVGSQHTARGVSGCFGCMAFDFALFEFSIWFVDAATDPVTWPWFSEVF